MFGKEGIYHFMRYYFQQVNERTVPDASKEKCVSCGYLFKPKDLRQKFCTDRCRWRYYNKKRARNAKAK